MLEAANSNGGNSARGHGMTYRSVIDNGAMFANPRYDPEQEAELQRQLVDEQQQQQAWLSAAERVLPTSFVGRDGGAEIGEVRNVQQTSKRATVPCTVR